MLWLLKANNHYILGIILSTSLLIMKSSACIMMQVIFMDLIVYVDFIIVCVYTCMSLF